MKLKFEEFLRGVNMIIQKSYFSEGFRNTNIGVILENFGTLEIFSESQRSKYSDWGCLSMKSLTIYILIK